MILSSFLLTYVVCKSPSVVSGSLWSSATSSLHHSTLWQYQPVSTVWPVSTRLSLSLLCHGPLWSHASLCPSIFLLVPGHVHAFHSTALQSTDASSVLMSSPCAIYISVFKGGGWLGHRLTEFKETVSNFFLHQQVESHCSVSSPNSWWNRDSCLLAL